MSESNKNLVTELMSAWNDHDIGRAAACIGEACNGGGSEGFRRELTGFLSTFPDLAITLEDILAEGNKVATRVTMRATQSGALGNIPATGRDVVMKANHIFHCAGGKVVQRHGQMDRLEVMTQLGMKVVPNEQSSPERG